MAPESRVYSDAEILEVARAAQKGGVVFEPGSWAGCLIGVVAKRIFADKSGLAYPAYGIEIFSAQLGRPWEWVLGAVTGFDTPPGPWVDSPPNPGALNDPEEFLAGFKFGHAARLEFCPEAKRGGP